MTYPEVNWKKNEYHQLKEVVDLLKAIRERESKRHQMDEHLTPHTADVLLEVIIMLDEEIDYDPSSPYVMDEPPITLDEMHTAAWKEHQAMHS